MTTRDTTPVLQRLNTHCAMALEAAASLCKLRLSDEITVEHWLLTLLEAGDGDIPAIMNHYGIDVDVLWDVLMSTIDRLPRNLRKEPILSSQLVSLLHACADHRHWPIRSANLLQVIVDSPHVLRAPSLWPLLNFSSTQVGKLLPELGAQTCETPQPLSAPSALVESMLQTSFESSMAGTGASCGASASSGGGTVAPLARYTTDLTECARSGELDDVFGRDREIQRVVEVLAKSRKNSPILVGDPGVGKTALIDGLALRVANGDVPDVIRDLRILALNLESLRTNAENGAEFQQQLSAVIDAVQASAEPVLLFIDEVQTLFNPHRTIHGTDIANLFKRTLACGDVRTITTTTWAEYKTIFEHDATLARRCQMIEVDEPDDDAACLMLRGLKWHYATFHRVHVRDEALVAAVKLARRYIPTRKLPEKAFDLLDAAAGRVRMSLDVEPAALQQASATLSALEIEQATLEFDVAEGGTSASQRLKDLEVSLHAARAEVDDVRVRCASERELVDAIRAQRDAAPEARDAYALALACEALAQAQDAPPLVSADVDARVVAQIVSEWTGIPVGNLMVDEPRDLLSLDAPLRSRVAGQQDAVQGLVEHLRTANAGLTPEHAPAGAFLLTGPSGVGKTETALALADILFGSEAALIPLNFSEHRESHSVFRLTGTLPEAVGHGLEGVLTEAVRQRPYSVVLLDELEYAPRDVLDLLCRIFDGRVTRDDDGRAIDFRNCVFLMTSSIGANTIESMAATHADAGQDTLLDAIRPAMTSRFPSALLARVQTLVYRPLDTPALGDVVQMKLAKVAQRLKRKRGITLLADDSLVTMLVRRCLTLNAGAHGVDAYLNQQILPRISREILASRVSGDAPQCLSLTMSQDGQLAIHVAADIPRQ
ncbi:AAA domain-containing protein [Pandoraea fibrosis]|uniref:AAA domain-containing protein n=1 Tax=Pandoraea fibrosis TaxID=1891094 RepID=A0ABX6HR85_9BURK|nr:AAA family ATPase [Pandoraea fibrosis]QHE93025.1 AAA domain-containing protein [Pandoraea fibrosis]QHF13417.1 AAA domain-containing protein [Pandoraea fibrosis]